jgi:hypothetical protein
MAIAVFAVFAYNVYRYFFLCDDAFITFRYSKNFATGIGLVWNPGEIVEGYTNFLWMLIMAAGVFCGIQPEGLSTALSISSGAVILLFLARAAAKHGRWNDPTIWILPGVLALNRSFAAWSTSGLETQFFSLLVLLGYLTSFDERNQQKKFPWLSSSMFALAALARPEGGIFMAGAGICFLADVLLKRRSFLSLILWCLPFVFVVGAHFLWRHSYYGYWFPNTFYAKVGGFWPTKARHFFSTFLSDYKLHWFFPLAVICILFRRSYASMQFLVSATIYLSYVYYIGGDFLEFRFLVPIFPYLFWLMVDGARVIFELRPRRKLLRWTAWAAGSSLWLLLAAATHYFSESMKTAQIRDGNETIQITRRYCNLRIQQGRALGDLVDRGLLPADLRIETGGVGALPYYTGWYTLDKHGLNDVFIAHQSIRVRRQIAHEHMASLKYVKEKQIAVSLIQNKLLYDLTGPEKERRLDKLKKWLLRSVKKRNSKLGKDSPLLMRLKCLAVEPDRYLVFATNLDERDLDKLLGHLAEC